jgi:anti-sigma B factor antagonist
LEIVERDREGIAILDLDDRLTVGPPSGVVREAITAAQTAGKLRIILNLKGVDYIDSTGLGTLVICFTSLQKAGGALKLVYLNKRNLELLVLTKLSTVFELFNDEQDAVNSFFPNREIKRFDILDFIQQHQQES